MTVIPTTTQSQIQGTKQQLHLTQGLMMSAHMQQALHLLQVPLQELEPFIEEQIILNPLLEIAEDEEEPQEEEELFEDEEEKEVSINDEDLSILARLEEDLQDRFAESEAMPIKRSSEEDKLKTYLEQSVCSEPTLYEKLLQQSCESFETQKEFHIAEILIGYFDSSGFLTTPLSEIAALHHFKEEEIQPILAEIQTFEPYGIGASTIQESLLIQLRCLKKEHSIAYQIISDYYQDLLHNHLPSIQKKLQCSYEEIQKAIEQDIAKLDLHPGTHFSSRQNQALIPDVILREENDHLIVEVERDYTPSIRINPVYLKMLKDPNLSTETKQFIKHHFLSAKWLFRNLEQRYSTIERIAQVLAKKQYQFFMQPDGKLTPLTMKMVAEELGLHESTIARTVSNKYLYSPRGLFSLRSFFTNKYVTKEGEDLSSTTVKEAILDLITKEDKVHPLSDEKISILLKEKGIICARRTIAKYRLALQIGNTQQRKKFH